MHRDIKPSNLFLTTRADGTPLLKVLDFGIAKALELDRPGGKMAAKVTRTGDLLGSPDYMSPEQIRDSSKVDQRSDLWAVGCTLYELVTGQAPFLADTLPALCAKVAADRHRPTSELVKGTPEGFDAVIDRCLEKKPTRRYADVAELAEALAPFASDEGRRLVAPIQRLLGGPTVAPASRRSSHDSRADTVIDRKGAHTAHTLIRSLLIPLHPSPARWIALAVATSALLLVGLWYGRRSDPVPRDPPAPLAAPIAVRPPPAAASSMEAEPQPSEAPLPAEPENQHAAKAPSPAHRAQPRPTIRSVASASATPSATAAVDPLADRK